MASLDLTQHAVGAELLDELAAMKPVVVCFQNVGKRANELHGHFPETFDVVTKHRLADGAKIVLQSIFLAEFAEPAVFISPRGADFAAHVAVFQKENLAVVNGLEVQQSGRLGEFVSRALQPFHVERLLAVSSLSSSAGAAQSAGRAGAPHGLTYTGEGSSESKLAGVHMRTIDLHLYPKGWPRPSMFRGIRCEMHPRKHPNSRGRCFNGALQLSGESVHVEHADMNKNLFTAPEFDLLQATPEANRLDLLPQNLQRLAKNPGSGMLK